MDNEPCELNPCNGFRVESQERKLEWQEEGKPPSTILSVLLFFRLNGKLLSRYEVFNAEDSPRARGQQQRFYALWSAIARFMDTGGRMARVQDQLTSVNNELQDLLQIFPELELPEGFYLISTSQEPEVVQHIYGNDKDGSAIVVEEDTYAERTTLLALQEGLEPAEINDSNTVT